MKRLISFYKHHYILLLTGALLMAAPPVSYSDVLTDQDATNLWDKTHGWPGGNWTDKYSLRLYYYPSRHLVISGLERSVSEGSANWSLGWIPPNVAITGGSGLSPAALSNPTDNTFLNHELVVGHTHIVFDRCWGLRGRPKGPNVRVSVAFTGGSDTQNLYTADNSSMVTASNPIVKANGQTGSNINLRVNAWPIWPFWPVPPVVDQPIIGNIEMDLDLTHVTKAGLHSGGRFTITVELL